MSKHEKFGMALAYIDLSEEIPEHTKSILKQYMKDIKCEAFDLGYDVKVASTRDTIMYTKDKLRPVVKEILQEFSYNAMG